MIKKITLSMLVAASLFAADVVVMPDGKTAIINKDGSWEEVTLAKMGDKTIALKKNGTWVEVDKQIKTIKPKVKNETVEVKESVQKRDPLSGFAKNIIGQWKSDNGKVEYTFDKNYKMKIIKNGEVIEDDFTVVKYDESKKTINIGKGKRFKMGPFSMGGKILKFRFSKDLNSLYDLSEIEDNYKEVRLTKVK